MNDDNKVLAAIGAVVAVPVTMIIEGWVISIMWWWFIVLLGVVQIGIAHSLGISAVVSLFKSASPKNDDTLFVTILKAIFQPLFVLFIGWIIHLFM